MLAYIRFNFTKPVRSEEQKGNRVRSAMTETAPDLASPSDSHILSFHCSLTTLKIHSEDLIRDACKQGWLR